MKLDSPVTATSLSGKRCSHPSKGHEMLFETTRLNETAPSPSPAPTRLSVRTTNTFRLSPSSSKACSSSKYLPDTFEVKIGTRELEKKVTIADHSKVVMLVVLLELFSHQLAKILHSQIAALNVRQRHNSDLKLEFDTPQNFALNEHFGHGTPLQKKLKRGTARYPL